MKPRVYVETSVISYLTNRLALDVISAGHQATTLKWWEEQRPNYDVVISQCVLDEIGAGDATPRATPRGVSNTTRGQVLQCNIDALRARRAAWRLEFASCVLRE